MKSIHGWEVIEKANDPRLKNLLVPGTKRYLKVRADIGGYLIAFASEFHELISPIDVGTYDDWGWSPLRDGRASNLPSDHCAGVALDLNATTTGSQSKSNVFWIKHPLKALAMRKLLKKYNLIEWGGDYKRAYDPMHVTFKFELNATKVKAEMKRMGITPSGIIKPS